MPLHSAVARNHYEISKLLISKGADVNGKQQGGFTPLHEAAQNGNLRIATLLLNSGAKLNIKNEDGKTPLDLTKIGEREAGKKEDRERVAELLLRLEVSNPTLRFPSPFLLRTLTTLILLSFSKNSIRMFFFHIRDYP
jgi:ankyrin repeat protein